MTAADFDWDPDEYFDPYGGLGLIQVSAVGRVHGQSAIVAASRLASVISCPHCRDRSDLDRFVGCAEGAALPDGGVR